MHYMDTFSELLIGVDIGMVTFKKCCIFYYIENYAYPIPFLPFLSFSVFSSLSFSFHFSLKMFVPRQLAWFLQMRGVCTLRKGIRTHTGRRGAPRMENALLWGVEAQEYENRSICVLY